MLNTSSKPIVNGVLPGPRATRLLEKQRMLESTGVSYPTLLPLVPQRIDGPWIEDVDGNIFLDLMSMAGSLPMGHNELLGTIFRDQSKDMMTALDFPTEVRLRFLSRLASALKKHLAWDTVSHLTGPTGSNAVEAALKLARWKTGRNVVVFLEGSYHGMTAGAASVSDIRSPAQSVSVEISETIRVQFPCSEGNVETAVSEIEKIIHRISREGRGVAAVIIEPIQGEGGVRPLPLCYPQALQEMLKKHGVLLIVDEVQTGFGRCGTLFAIEEYGIRPDIMVFSKAASGVGAPLAGITFSKSLNGWPPGSHIGTFRGFAPAFAAGEHFLHILCTTKMLEGVTQQGANFIRTLQEGLKGSSIVADVRGRGYLIGLDIRNAGTPDAARAAKAVKKLFENGIVTETGGIHGNVIRLLPPLNVPPECLSEAARIIINTFLHK